MNSPTEQSPFAAPEARDGQQPLSAQIPPPNGPLSWQPSSLAPKQANGLAIATLVVAGLTLLVVLGFVVFGVVLGGLMGASGGSNPSGDLQGTAPQVVAGQPYPGTQLKDEVTRVIEGDSGEVESMSCPATRAVVADAVTVCHGMVDGGTSSVKVTFEDGMGHFTLVEN